MITDYLRKVVDRLSQLPASVQDQLAAEIEGDLDQREGSAAQATSPSQERQESQTYPGYPLGVNPMERYIGKLVDRYPHLSDDEVLALEAAGDLPDDDAR